MVKLKKIFFIYLISFIFLLILVKKVEAAFCNSRGCWTSVICKGTSYTLSCSGNCECPESPCRDGRGNCVNGTVTSEAGCDPSGNPYIICTGCSCGGGGGANPSPSPTPTCPTCPIGVFALAVRRVPDDGNYNISLSWNDVANEGGYQIFRYGNPIANVGSNVTSFVDTNCDSLSGPADGCPFNTSRTYEVRPIREGCSLSCGVVNITWPSGTVSVSPTSGSAYPGQLCSYNVYFSWSNASQKRMTYQHSDGSEIVWCNPCDNWVSPATGYTPAGKTTTYRVYDGLQLLATSSNFFCNLIAPTPINTPTPTPTSAPTPITSWFQTQGGDVHSNADLFSKIPDSRNFFSLNGEGGYPGLISTFTKYPFFGQGKISEKNWLAVEIKNKRRYDYSYFNTLLKIPQENVVRNNNEFLSSTLEEDKINEQPITNSPLWKIEGDLEVENLNENLGVKVFLTSGKIIFKNDLNLRNTLPIFIAQGDIEIKPEVHILTGVLISSGKINTGRVKEDKSLTVRGAVISWDNLSLERERENNNQPAEFFVYNPEIPLSLIPFLGKSPHLWEELAP